MTTINFYSYNGHPNTVNKQLGEFTAIEGDLRQTFDVLRPTVTLRKHPDRLSIIVTYPIWGGIISWIGKF
jgi:hypothetical protein